MSDNTQDEAYPLAEAKHRLKASRENYGNKIQSILTDPATQIMMSTIAEMKRDHEKAINRYIEDVEKIWVRSTVKLDPVRQRQIRYAGLKGQRGYLEEQDTSGKEIAVAMLDARMEAIKNAIPVGCSLLPDQARNIMRRAEENATALLSETQDINAGNYVLNHFKVGRLYAGYEAMGMEAPRIQRAEVIPNMQEQRQQLDKATEMLSMGKTVISEVMKRQTVAERAELGDARRNARMYADLNSIKGRSQENSFTKTRLKEIEAPIVKWIE